MPEQHLTPEDAEIVRRLADGEDCWTVDPDYGCTNPLTGYFPTDEVRAERIRRWEHLKASYPADGWDGAGAAIAKHHARVVDAERVLDEKHPGWRGGDRA